MGLAGVAGGDLAVGLRQRPRDPERAVQLARDSGALEVLAVADNVCGQAAAWGGDFELATLMVAEVEAVKDATGSRIGPYTTIALVGLRGRDVEGSTLIEGVIEGGAASGQEPPSSTHIGRGPCS